MSEFREDDGCIYEMREKLSRLACEALEKNKECYVAYWVLQNPDAKISDYSLCVQNDWAAGEQRFWMEKK